MTTYYIGRCWWARTLNNHLYLYRSSNGIDEVICRFRSLEKARLFADEFGFPLSESIQSMIKKAEDAKRQDQ